MLASCLSKMNIIHFFIYRDLRDVVVSEMFYLKSINKMHALHAVFKDLKNDDERLKFAIMGNEYIQTKYPYPNIAKRFEWYKGWLSDDSCYSIKFENLINNDTKNKEIVNIIKHLQLCGVMNIDESRYISLALNNIQPRNSHTYREGVGRSWRKHFNDEHILLFKKYAGDLLVELEYETNLKW